MWTEVSILSQRDGYIYYICTGEYLNLIYIYVQREREREKERGGNLQTNLYKNIAIEMTESKKKTSQTKEKKTTKTKVQYNAKKKDDYQWLGRVGLYYTTFNLLPIHPNIIPNA